MGFHPINLFLRFLLEIFALFSLAIWGWNQSESWFRLILMVGLPFFAAIIWGVFAVPNDPSRSGSSPIATNGIIRLIIEFGIFSFAILSLNDLGWNNVSLVFGILTLAHYIISYDRVLWLVTKK